MLLRLFATEAGRMETACWSSTQHGIRASGLMGLGRDAECACSFRVLRRPVVLLAFMSENYQSGLNR